VSREAIPPKKADMVHYGYRFVRRVGPDGSPLLEQVPLTLEDLLHPLHTVDYRYHSEEHVDDICYLRPAIKKHLGPSMMRFSEHRIAWDDAESLVHASDISVFKGPKERRRPGSTYFVESEGAEPVLIIEIVSPDSRINEVVHKVPEYHRAQVPLYVIVDTRYRKGVRVSAEFIAYRYAEKEYQRFYPDEQGRLWIEPLQIYLKIVGVQVQCFTWRENETFAESEAARVAEVAARLKAEEQARVATEAQKAAEKRIRELERLLREMQTDSARPTQPAGNDI